MFSSFIRELETGKMPETKALAQRFSLALTKKMGIMKIPYLSRPADPKINPDSEHLLWAAIVLEDGSGVQAVEGIIAMETADAERTGQDIAILLKNRITKSISSLESTVSGNALQPVIAARVKKVVPQQYWLKC